MQQPLFEHRLQLAGVQTRALELEGAGPPLLLLHGFMDSADTWRPTLARLARQGRAALAIDFPGFGSAARLDRDELVLPQLDRVARAAVELLAEQHGQDVVVCGNSLGGCVALRLAEDPELPLAAVVPVSPAGFDHPVWFRTLEGDALVRTVLQGVLPDRVVRAFVGQAYRQLVFFRPRAADARVVAAFCSHMGSQRDLRRMIATGRRVVSELREPFHLDRIAGPVTLVWGDHDRMVTHKGSRHLVEALPALHYELLPDCGHCPQLEATDRFVELLLQVAVEPAHV